MSDDTSLELRGDGRNVTRYRGDKAGTLVNLYLDARGQHTVADLIAAIAEAGATPEDVTFRGGCFVLHLPSTDEDRAGWALTDAQKAERAQKSRREWYERLRAEFGDDS